MHWLVEYGIFLAKVATIVVAVIIVFAVITSIAAKNKLQTKGKLKVQKLNEHYESLEANLETAVLDKKSLKKQRKLRQQKQKQAIKTSRKKIFLLDFKGDIRAQAVASLRQEIDVILRIASQQDEVVLRLESPGGLVHAYGLAASQLKRLRDRQIPLTICIDKVAASGGYLMACIGDKILAAPFAIIGSIGVIAQLPNFHRFLKKHDIDFEQIMAGEYKRTLTVFGENTKQGRIKFQEQVNDTQDLFKNWVAHERQSLNVEQVATGEYWYGSQAKDLKLIDAIITSDEYLFTASQTADIYQIEYRFKKRFADKLAKTVKQAYSGLQSALFDENQPAGYL